MPCGEGVFAPAEPSDFRGHGARSRENGPRFGVKGEAAYLNGSSQQRNVALLVAANRPPDGVRQPCPLMDIQ